MVFGFDMVEIWVELLISGIFLSGRVLVFLVGFALCF